VGIRRALSKTNIQHLLPIKITGALSVPTNKKNSQAVELHGWLQAKTVCPGKYSH